MKTVHGHAKKIKKEDHKCPNDGIHRKKDSGRIRGFWGLKLNNEPIWYGNWAYYRFSQNTTGYKVFYSFKFAKTTKTIEEAQRTFNMMKMLKKFCPEVHKITYVTTDIWIGKKHCHGISPAIRMQHVFYPQKAWKDFAKGKRYDWGASDHPGHSIEGFKRFRNELETFTSTIDYDFDHFSIGNIVWCTNNNRWYLVDVR